VSVQFFPLESCREQAELVRTALVNSVAHLFQDGFTPDPSNVLADYTAEEADFDGYAAETMAAWFPAILAEGSGYMIQSPWVQFEFDPSPGTPTNVINGMYLVTAGGDLWLTVIFTNPIPMQVDGQGIGFNLTLLFPTGV